ncbi:MAG: PAS domain S-box protein [Rhodospirillales bacterium]|nr:MAG: PAS domain S-box protein [Rhodospirillales bacterium]
MSLVRTVAEGLWRFVEDLPLRPAIAAALVLGLFMPVLVSVWRDLEERRTTLLAHLTQDHALLTQLLAIGMQTPIWEVRPIAGQPLVDTLIGDTRVTEVTVSSPLLPQFLSASAPERRSGELLIREIPVERDGEIIGSVRLEMTTGPLEGEIARQWSQVLFTGVLQLTLGLLLVVPLLRLKVLGPVSRLMQQSQALARGDLETPFAWTRGDELGDLGRRFDATRCSLATLFADLAARNAELERHRAELAEQTSVLRAVMDNMTDGISLVDGDLRLVICNRQFEAMFDLPPDLLKPGVRMTDLHRFDSERGRWQAENPKSYLVALAATYTPDRETVMTVDMADGQVIQMRRRPIPGGGYVSTYTDVSAEVQAKRRAEEALKLLEAVMDAVPAVLHVKDHDLRYRMINRHFVEVSGLRRADVIGKTSREAFASERFENYRDRDLDVLATGRALPFYETRIQLYGRERWDALSTKVPLLDDRGRITHIVTVELDITERKKAEAALRESEELHRLLVDLSPFGIMVHDHAGIVFVNRAGCRILGLARPENAVGRHYLDFVLPAERNEAAERTVRALEAGEELAPTERRLKTDDGRIIDVAVAAVPFTRAGQRFALVMFRDITDSKRLERALRESERHFRSLVEGHPLPVWVVDADSGDILYESPHSAELFGRPWPPERSRNAITHWFDPEERGRFLSRLENEGELRDFEWHARKENGAPFWVLVNARLIRRKDRRLVVASMFDLTERKQREAEMREARETLEDAIESLSEGFALFDDRDRLVICNRRYREFHSVSGDLLAPGVTWTEFHREAGARGEFTDADGMTAERLAAMLDCDADGPRTLEVKHADGRWYQLSHQRTRRQGSAVIRTEITHLKTMEQALRDSEDRFRRIAEAHPVPVAIVSLDEGEILYASPAAAALFGRPLPALIGSRMTEFYENPAQRADFVALFRQQGYVDSFEVRYRRDDGTVFPVAIRSRPIVYEGHEAVVSGVFDLTERKAAEAEIAKQREALHQSEKLNALGSLLAGVAHELNNPLSVVVGRSIMLEGADMDERTANNVTKIRAAAERCARIVKTFLAMARQQAPSRVPVRLADIIDASLDLVGYRLRSGGVDVVRDIEADLPETLADPDQLNQVFSNLFLNAQQAMAEVAPGGRKVLTIRGRYLPAEQAISLEVRDTGPGIPREVMPRIFDPFFTTKPAGIGTGIGLAVTHGIIRSHDGKISVSTPPGGGACFRIVLPVRTGADATAAEQSRDGSVSGGQRILVVDDEAEIGQMLADILVAEGHRVTLAASGREALDAVAKEPFDLVVSDLVMPELDGSHLYRMLLENHPHLASRTVFMTGDTLSRSAKAFVRDSARPLIEKPFTPEEAVRVIREALISATLRDQDNLAGPSPLGT